MMKYLYLMVLGLGLVSLPALAQEDPAEDSIEVIVEAGEAVEEAKEPEADTDEPIEADTDEGEDVKIPETDEEAVAVGLSIVDAIRAEQWPLAVGLFLTLLVFLVHRFGLKDKLSEKVVPWVALGVGALGGIGTGLASGVPVLEAVLVGLVGAGAAVGGWDMVFRYLSGSEPGSNES